MPEVKKIGRTLYLRIPHDIVDKLHISEGESFTVEVKDACTIIYRRVVPHGSVWRLVPADFRCKDCGHHFTEDEALWDCKPIEVKVKERGSVWTDSTAMMVDLKPKCPKCRSKNTELVG